MSSGTGWADCPWCKVAHHSREPHVWPKGPTHTVEAQRIAPIPCAGCAAKDAAVTTLRNQLAESLAANKVLTAGIVSLKAANSANEPANTAANVLTVSGAAANRNDYQREFMRKDRAAKRAAKEAAKHAV